MGLSRMGVDDLFNPLHRDFEFTGKGFHCLSLRVSGADLEITFGFGQGSVVGGDRRGHEGIHPLHQDNCRLHRVVYSLGRNAP